MDDPQSGDRHSVPVEPDLITNSAERAEREVANGLRQIATVLELVDAASSGERPFKLRSSTILQLHRIALEGISSYAGNFRPSDIKIQGSGHTPPPAFLVPELLEELCDYVNENFDGSAIHLAAYVMWRLNWIHGFTDGNGRTSRAASYLILCVRLGSNLPGEKTIPEQISESKQDYYDALEAAGNRFADGEIDVSALEKLLGDYLAVQLVHVFKKASEAAPGKQLS